MCVLLLDVFNVCSLVKESIGKGMLKKLWKNWMKN